MRIVLLGRGKGAMRNDGGGPRHGRGTATRIVLATAMCIQREVKTPPPATEPHEEHTGTRGGTHQAIKQDALTHTKPENTRRQEAT